MSLQRSQPIAQQESKARAGRERFVQNAIASVRLEGLEQVRKRRRFGGGTSRAKFQLSVPENWFEHCLPARSSADESRPVRLSGYDGPQRHPRDSQARTPRPL